jgi:acetyl esterase
MTAVDGDGQSGTERDLRQVAELLDILIAAGRPSSRTLPLAAGRLNFNDLVASLTSTAQVAGVEDRVVAASSASVPVRLYRPHQAAGNGPVAVFMHGGGWVFGDLESHDGLCRALAQASGVVIVAVDYRRAPETPFPGPLEDCLAVTGWLADHGSEVGIDGTRLGVVGDSSGANLAAAVAALARDAGYPRVSIQCLVYAATDPSLSTASYAEYAEDPFLSRDEVAWYWDQYTTPEQRPDVRAAVGLNSNLAGLPPAVVVIAGRDPLRDEGVAYAHALQAAGVPTVVHYHPEMPHGFLLFGRYLDRANEVISEVGAALAKGLALDDAPDAEVCRPPAATERG